MIKLIKEANKKVATEIKVGDLVRYTKMIHDGRSYQDIYYVGSVTQVNKVTVDFETKEGNVYRASKNEVTIL
jgi:hypothetical protein